MLNQEALVVISKMATINSLRKYTVVLDNTKRDVGPDELLSKDYTVIYNGNNYDKAVEITNFWDERQNVHLVTNDVKKIRFEKQAVATLVANNMTIPSDSEIFDQFSKIDTHSFINLMAEAAKIRVSAS